MCVCVCVCVYVYESESVSFSVMSDSLQPHELYLCPWNSPSKNIGGVAIPFSRGSSWPRDTTRVSCTAGRFFTIWATKKALYVCMHVYIEMFHKSDIHFYVYGSLTFSSCPLLSFVVTKSTSSQHMHIFS